MNKQVLNEINNNKFIVYLEEIGIEVSSLKNAILKNYNEGELEPFINRSKNRLSPNVYIEKLVFEEVCQYLFKEYKDSVIFEEEVKLDIKTIIATSKSLIQRPEITKPSNKISGFYEPSYEGDFRIISRFERELSQTNYMDEILNKGGVVFEGLLPVEIEAFPMDQESPSNGIWNKDYCIGTPFIQGFNSNFNGLETQCVLWLNSDLINKLRLRLDHFNNGLRALNEDNEVILNFRYWRKQLIGNGVSFIGANSNIAVLEGCDLLMRDDYFNKLKLMIPDLVYYIDVS